MTAEERDFIWQRDQGRCIWPHCGRLAAECAHFHSRGHGGSPSRNHPDNVGLMCSDHARISDGEYGAGGARQYAEAHAGLLGDGWRALGGGTLAWERAEALTAHLRTRQADLRALHRTWHPWARVLC